MAERLILTLILIAAGTAVYFVFKRQHVRQIGRLAVGAVPTILYFGSDSCAACPTQARYLEQLHGEWHGRLLIQKIDVEREPEKASQFHVLTLPTTILVDPVGQVREINYGLTNSHKLVKQLRKLMEIGD